MSDIKERLRKAHLYDHYIHVDTASTMKEAADYIEQLEAAYKALQELLRAENELVQKWYDEWFDCNELLNTANDRIATLEATNAAQAEQLAEAKAEAQEMGQRYLDASSEMDQVCDKLGIERDLPLERILENIDQLQFEHAALLQSSIPPEPQAGVELTFDIIEDVLPDGPMLDDGRIAVSAQQLHNFARAIERALNQRQAVKAEPRDERTWMIPGYIELRGMVKEWHATAVSLGFDSISQALRATQDRDSKPLSAAQGVPERWLPIETAPTDGTVIIALQCWIYHTDAARRPHYVLHEVFFNDDGGWEVVEDGEILDEDSLTHWLPRTLLPAAPEQAESKEGKE
jgi:hypothetical protein